MIAVDTNVVVRLLLADDMAQAAQARVLFAENSVAIAHTVLIEAEWVMRHVYRVPRADIVSAFRRLLGMDGVVINRVEAVARAIAAFAAGSDFADAVHTLADYQVEAFVTFDRDLARNAETYGLPPVRLLKVA